MIKITQILFITGLILVSANSMSEVHFYNKHTIKNVKINEETTEEYFDLSTCGVYHCYAMKGSTVYSIGYNGQGQLGSFEKVNQKDWKISFENVNWIKATDFGGCLETKKGKLFKTGTSVKDLNSIKGSVRLVKWTETNKCFEN